jgi:hypothetical protein
MCKTETKGFFKAVMVAALTTGLGMASTALAEVRVQVVHAAPFADSLEGTSVTVTANGSPVLENFLFKDFTEYLTLPAGDYDLAVIPTGSEEPAIQASVTLESGTDYTVLAVGDGVNQELALWPLVDNVAASGDGNLNIRVVHAAPFAASDEATEVSIRTAGGVIVNNLVGVPFFAQSGFFPIPAGNYDLKVASNDGRTNLIDPLPVDLPAGIDLTVIAIGDGANQPLGILALPVGELETRAPVDNSANGWWSSAAGGNEGFILQPIPAENRLVGTAYTYDLGGSGAPFWVTFDSCQQEIGDPACPAAGAFDGRSAVANVFAFSGGTVGGSEPADGAVVGTVAFEIIDCETAIAALALADGTEVTWDLTRLTFGIDCTLD